MTRYCFASLSLLVIGCAGPRQGDTTFPVSYFAPHAGGTPSAAPACSSPVKLEVTDSRQTPLVVGERYEQEKPTVKWAIKMQGDPAAYVRAALERSLPSSGSGSAGKTPADLAITIKEISLEEKTWYNAEFRGRIGLDAALKVASSSKSCWSGQVIGNGSNYGKAGNALNYQETLNRALDDARDQLLQAPGFADALCGKCSP